MKIQSLILFTVIFSTLAFAKGKSGFDPKVCWDLVIAEYQSWPNSCKGKVPEPKDVCSESLVPLTTEEYMQYQSWIAAMSPPTPCQEQK